MTDPIPAIAIRADMINGTFDLTDDVIAYMKLVREKTAALGAELTAARPSTADIGRFIAALDSLQHTKNLFCDAVILGTEANTRKKRKSSEATAD